MAATAQQLTRLDLLIERHQPALEKSIEALLKDLPETGIVLTRKDLADMIRAGFASGLTDAHLHHLFLRPCGTPRQGTN